MAYRREPLSSGRTSGLDKLRIDEFERAEKAAVCFELRLSYAAAGIPAGFDANLQADLLSRGVRACSDLLTVWVEGDVPGHSVFIFLRWTTGAGAVVWPTLRQALARYGITATGDWTLARLVRESPGGGITDGGAGTGREPWWRSVADWFRLDLSSADDWVRLAATVAVAITVLPPLFHAASSYFQARAQEARVREVEARVRMAASSRELLP